MNEIPSNFAQYISMVENPELIKRMKQLYSLMTSGSGQVLPLSPADQVIVAAHIEQLENTIIKIRTILPGAEAEMVQLKEENAGLREICQVAAQSFQRLVEMGAMSSEKQVKDTMDLVVTLRTAAGKEKVV